MNYRNCTIIKRLSLIVFLSVCYTANVWCQDVKASQIERRNRIAYLKGSATPFTGKAVDTYKSGSKKSEENFVNGMKEGLLKTWFENGKQESQKSYKANKLEGTVMAWYENGTVERKVEFSNDKKHGSFQTFHENGKPKELGQFVNGEKNGVYKSWFENGQIESEVTFVNGKENGTYVEYFENGKKYCEKKYVAGEESTTKYWTETGRQMTIEEVNDMIKQMQSGNLMQQWQQQGGK
jgi:uncharacterized protein